MEIKPIKLGTVQPVKVQPVQVQQVQVQQVGDSKELMATLFGKNAVKNSEENEKKTALDASKAERQAEIKKAAAEASSNKEDKKETKKEPKKEAKKYEGPREVKVYGMTLYTEEDPNVSLDDIRQRIVSEYHYPEFSAGRTVMTIDEETGIVVPVIKFEKKG